MSRTPEVPGYVLVDRLRRGPAADVWRASRAVDGRPVAVKIPATGPVGSDTLTEAALLRTVRHPNVLGLVDAVVLEDGRTCVVTDLADGGSLADLVAARGRLTVGEVTAVLAPVADALWTLHRQGVVHGDVAPGNVLFTDGGRPLLADLGAASAAHTLGGAWGTDGFVAAEVLAGGEPTAESDVFGLGALVVHALTGQGVSPLEQVDRVLRRCTDVVDLPEELDDLLRGLLAGAVADRPRAVDAARVLAELADPDGPDIGGRSATELVTYRVRSARRADARRVDPDDAGRRARLRALAERAREGRVVRLVLAVVAALALVVVGWGPVRGLLAGRDAPVAVPVGSGTASAEPRPSGRPTATTGTTGAVAAAPATATTAPAGAARGTGPTDPTASPGGVVKDPAGVLRSVLTRRAEAMARADRAALAEVDLPGSWAAERDDAILTALDARSERLSGLRFTVTDARVVSASSSRALVEATVAHAPYRATRAGATRTAPAGAPRRERYGLVWQDGRWLVSTVEAA